MNWTTFSLTQIRGFMNDLIDEKKNKVFMYSSPKDVVVSLESWVDIYY